MFEIFGEELTSWWMLLSLAYLALIAFRSFILIRDALGGQGANLVAGAFIIFLVFAFFASGGGTILLVSFAFLIIMVGSIAIALGGFSAGINLKANPIAAIPSIMLIIMGFILGFLDPNLGNPIYIVLLALNIFVAYKLRGDLLQWGLGSSQILSYLLVWPPMILLLALSELMLLPLLISPPWHGIIVGIATITTAIVGLYAYQH